jgi:uridine kinase
VELLGESYPQIRHRSAIEAPIYDFTQHLRVRERWEHIPAKPPLIVEGIRALHFAELRPHFNLSIYLDAPNDVFFHRRKVRDITERQRAVELVRRQHENTVLPAARQYLLPSKRYADLVLDAKANLEAVEKCLYDAITGKRALAAGR